MVTASTSNESVTPESAEKVQKCEKEKVYVSMEGSNLEASLPENNMTT